MGPSAEELLSKTKALFQEAEGQDLKSDIAAKAEEVRCYDVLAMQRIAAILMWGRSGSLLLSSYLDGHPDVIMLPEMLGERLYEFFERYPELSLPDKLMAYPCYEPSTPFFEGPFAISSARYYAAVEAIQQIYCRYPAEFLKSRRAFIVFAHLAYNVALGRRPADSKPLIVFAQHKWDNAVARAVLEDFAEAKFIHTVRDPISSCDGLFHYQRESLAERHLLLPYTALHHLIGQDRPHCGMDSRTHTIRFEDLHSRRDETLRDLADWLGLPEHPKLSESTFNGVPYVVTRNGVSWSGRRPSQVQRHSWNLSAKDRGLLFTVFYENFLEWDYAFPGIFRYSIARWIVFGSLILLPMKMELIATRQILKRRILPLLRQGRVWRALRSALGIGYCRVLIVRLLVGEFLRRRLGGTALLRVNSNKTHQPCAGAGHSQQASTNADENTRETIPSLRAR